MLLTVLNAIGTPLVFCDITKDLGPLIQQLIDNAILRRLFKVLKCMLNSRNGTISFNNQRITLQFAHEPEQPRSQSHGTPRKPTGLSGTCSHWRPDN